MCTQSERPLMLTIKPHHFMDIIKLHGAGLDAFVPDTAYGHAFYQVGNCILQNHAVPMRLTLGCDDICAPCKYKNAANGACTDTLLDLPGYTQKEAYNQMLDARIVQILHLDLEKPYTAEAFCALLAQHTDLVFAVWDIEPSHTTQRRHTLFCAGCKRYLRANAQ